jgi:glutamyl-tRNA synthetase
MNKIILFIKSNSLKPIFFLNSKYFHTIPNEVRVRFAPSPTGKLHIGGLRTAFYNYLFAKKYNGKFLLRIEDTDRDRIQVNSLENIIESLNWAKISPDYGPHIKNKDDTEQGAPWIQSHRLDIYDKYVKILLDTKKAYRCFCDEGRLQLLKRNAAKNAVKISYDGKCSHLSDQVVESYLKEGKSFVVRFKLVDKDVIYNDMTTGMHKSNIYKNEGDFILMKSDKYPTYHFANVVDDHLMRITHVIRGQEWQVSTAKHILIYEAFGWKHPEYLHLPLLCNNDNSKISKRQNDTELLSYRERGYLKESVLAYLSTIGGGSKVNIFDENCFFKSSKNVLNDLVNQFDETKMSCKSVKLNPELLDNINRRFIQLKINSSHLEEQMELVEALRELLLKNTKFKLNELYSKNEYLMTVLKWSSKDGRVSKLNELVTDNKYLYLWTDFSSKTKVEDLPKLKIHQLIESLILMCKNESLDFENTDNLKKEIAAHINRFKEEDSGAKVNYWHLCRLVLTGSNEGPPIVEIFQVLGKDNLINRLILAKKILN